MPKLGFRGLGFRVWTPADPVAGESVHWGSLEEAPATFQKVVKALSVAAALAKQNNLNR